MYICSDILYILASIKLMITIRNIFKNVTIFLIFYFSVNYICERTYQLKNNKRMMVFTISMNNMFRWFLLILCMVVLPRFRDEYLGLNSDKRNTDVAMIQEPQYDISENYNNWLYNIMRNYWRMEITFLNISAF